MTYSQAGNYTALAGVLVIILNKFGVAVVSEQIEGVIAAVVTIYGIFHQFIAHRKLAKAAGAIPQ